MGNLLRSLRRDQQGTTAVEFGIIAPVLIALSAKHGPAAKFRLWWFVPTRGRFFAVGRSRARGAARFARGWSWHPRIEIGTLYLRTVCFRTIVPDSVLSLDGWVPRSPPGTSSPAYGPSFPDWGRPLFDACWQTVSPGHKRDRRRGGHGRHQSVTIDADALLSGLSGACQRM